MQSQVIQIGPQILRELKHWSMYELQELKSKNNQECIAKSIHLTVIQMYHTYSSPAEKICAFGPSASKP